jgi:hypothetical protein
MVDHSGCPIWFSGAHLGVTSDITLWDDTHPILEPNERILADKAYNRFGIIHVIDAYISINILYVIANKDIAQQFKDPTTLEETAHNVIHGYFRATVEHTIGYIKRFHIIGGRYRGRLSNGYSVYLDQIMKVIMNITAFQVTMTPRRGPRVLSPFFPLLALVFSLNNLCSCSVNRGMQCW